MRCSAARQACGGGETGKFLIHAASGFVRRDHAQSSSSSFFFLPLFYDFHPFFFFFMWHLLLLFFSCSPFFFLDLRIGTTQL
jgi:hypothetical protein